jgi:sugar lactone lactonase YvrE
VHLLKRLSSFSALLVFLGGSFAARSAAAHPAWGIVVDPQGRVVFSEVETNTVWRIEQGRPVPILKGKHSHEIYGDGQGNLYGEHLEYRPAGERWLLSLWKLTPRGREIVLLPPMDAASLPPGLGPLRDRQGNTWAFRNGFQKVNEMSLYRRAPDGRTVAVAGGPPGHADGRGRAARFTTAQGKAFGPDGSLYVADGGTVRRITPDGTVTTLGGNPLGGLSHGRRPQLFGLAVGEKGRVFVADFDHGVVREIGLDGKVRERFRSDRFWAATGVATARGALYVLETRPEALTLMGRTGAAARVWKVAADGSRTLLATLEP